MDVVVTGARGTLGRRLVGELARRGHRVVATTKAADQQIAMIRYTHVDLATGEGLADAVAGVEAVIHCATDYRRAAEVDLGGMRRIAQATKPNTHLIYPGIVGADLISTSYYRAKTSTEEALVASGRPWSILRATQFHQLIWMWYATRSRKPFLFVPSQTRYQVLDPLEMAKRLVDLAESGPQGRVADMGGPIAYEAADLARSCQAAISSRRKVITRNGWGLAAAALRAGANLTPNRAGGETWNQFVERQMASSDARR